MRVLLAILCVVVVALATGCGGGGGGSSTSIFADSSCIGSPNGSVPLDVLVYSPDGKWYAKQATISGQIIIFDRATNERKHIIKALPVGEINDLKAMAWARDSLHMAFLYHGGTRSGIRIYAIETGEFVHYVGEGGTATEWYRYIVFNRDNTEVVASVDGKVLVRFPSRLSPI